MNTKRRFHPGVLWTWLTSYFLVLALPLVAAFASIAVSNGIIRQQTDAINAGALKLLSEASERRYEEILRDAHIIASNEQVVRLLAHTGITVYRDVYDMFRLKGVMNEIVQRNPAIRRMYIYLLDEDFIISNDTASRSDTFYRSEVSHSLIGPDEWRGMLARSGKGAFGRVPTKTGHYVLYHESLPVTSAQPRAALAIELAEDALTSLMSPARSSDETVMRVYSADGLLLAANASDTAAAEGGNMIRSSVASEKSGWLYESLIPRDIYLEETNQLKRVSVMIASAALCVCLLIIFYFVRKNYAPLSELVERLESGLKLRRTAQSEYVYLKDAIDRVLDNQKRSDKQLGEQKEQLRAAYLTRLLLGRGDLGVPAEEYLSLLEFDYASGLFTVVLFDFYGDPPALERFAADALARLGVYGYGVVISHRAALLMDTSGVSAADFRRRCVSLASGLAARCPSLVLAVSGVHQSSLGISAAYDEALFSVEYAMALDAEGAIFFSDIAATGGPAYYFPPEIERRMIQAIASGQDAAAREMIEHVWTRNLTSGRATPDQARVLISEFAATLLKAAAEQAGGGEAARRVLSSRLFSPQDMSIEDMRRELDLTLSEACALLQSRSADGDDELKNQVEAHIKKHYADPQLCIESLCETFSCSRSGLFKLFKANTGAGVHHLINETRIETAKTLLAETNLSVAEIAQRVGYQHQVTFLRIFKRHENLTPSRYREALSRPARR